MSDEKKDEHLQPRPEEIIAAILAGKQRCDADGRSPKQVILSPGQYRAIQEYRARLGEAPSASLEYLTKYEVFGLEICVEGTRPETEEPHVE